jgi:outer membrane protein assembly factor BamB
MPRTPLRLWPGLVAAVLLGLVRFGIPFVLPEAKIPAVLASLALALAILVWWMFFSRAPWSERLGVVGLMVVALFATSRIVHLSIRGGMFGMLLAVYAIPTLCVALVVCAVITRRLAVGVRRTLIVGAILLVSGWLALIRTEGITASATSQLAWRWSKTPEERLLAQGRVEAAAHPPAPRTGADWPGFRGPNRDGIIRGVRIDTDWSASPPVELWRRPIGPGWSSFAVQGDLLYTQEQRGDDEVVACYSVTTGEPAWTHRDATRFWEPGAGAGPRGTPAISEGRVYTFGATGILNALDAADGAVVWSRDVPSDTGAKIPSYGFSSSPLVVGDLVIVAASSQLAAYDLADGNPRWKGPVRGGSYSSPQLLTIDGVAQVLLMGRTGTTSVVPADGTLLWEHAWPGMPIVQPALIADGDLLISSAASMRGLGLRRIAVAHGPGGWTTAERWTSTGLKPYFNDFVVHKGHAYGFDGFILACIDVANGERKWKGGRYGNGQLILLADQDVLLVLSEEGELALVGATPDQFTELGRFPAIKGKTWNHPVLVGDVLLVRNGQEMAAFRLSLARR